MTTTSATTPTPTSSVSSIVQTLGSGSGIDTVSLVQQLVDAQFAVKRSQLSSQADTLTAQISAVSTLMSGLTGFGTALKSLVKGGTVSTQPTSSNAAIVKVSALAGASIVGLSGSLRVDQLATAQAATTNTAIPRTTAFNAGTLTLRFGTDSTDADGVTSFTPAGDAIDIAIGPEDTTLDGIAARINAANKGVTATVVTDSGGVRLTIKGATGAAQAFSLVGADTDPTATGASLASLSIDRDPAKATGTTIGIGAGDAIVALDGATFHRATNSISDLLTGVKLDLVAASTSSVTLGASAPTDGLRQSVGDFVDTFNQLHAIVAADVDPITGVLRSDTFVGPIARSLTALTTIKLATATTNGAPQTLADLGVATNRDGTLTVDSTKLEAALSSYPDAVEAMFAYGDGSATKGGISGALSAIVKQATTRVIDSSKDYSLNASLARYVDRQGDVSEAQDKITTDADATKTRLTVQYAKMDAAVAAYKSTQAFLQQQIDAWNSSDDN